ncbi:hypothetical protein LAZ67_5000061 [Cordylochernes scorpioides]|uniref:Fibrillar collagen NC1 domain-containing protein n=1 Tax=Cordylochernes scorpioides TaxID=51811 RepID=A0ABY6KFR4_9ARAC|nr:hypothetical protein LAZ67_5000061 [Cordylochernes scorpioides]
MRNLREAIRQKHPDLWKNKNWLLHHDNAPAHTSLLVHDFLAKNNTLMMPQPPYSPDLAPCDFFLFPKLRRPLKGRCYATLEEIKTASKEELKKILKNDFLKCFEDWKNRWHKCIISHGDYFEGDKLLSYVGGEVQLKLLRLLSSAAVQNVTVKCSGPDKLVVKLRGWESAELPRPQLLVDNCQVGGEVVVEASGPQLPLSDIFLRDWSPALSLHPGPVCFL